MEASEYQTLVLSEVGLSADALALASIESWWSFYSTASSTYLQYLLTKRHSLFYILSLERKKYDVQIGFDKLSKSQVFKNTLDMIKLLNDEIKLLDPEFGVPSLSVVTPIGGLPDIIEEIYDDLVEFGYVCR